MRCRLQVPYPQFQTAPSGATFSQPGLRKSVGSYSRINEDFVLVEGRKRGKADSVQEPVEGGVEALVESIEQRALAWRQGSVAGNGLEASGGQASVDTLEEL